MLCTCLGVGILVRRKVQPQLYADNLKCVSRDPGFLLRAARFTVGYVRLVGQEPAPRKCVLMRTSRAVRNDMRGWVVTDEGDRWLVKLNVRDLGWHQDSTFRGWSATLATGVRLDIEWLVLIFALPLDFHGRLRVILSMFILGALHGIEASFLAEVSLRKLRAAIVRVVCFVVSLLPILVRCLVCWSLVATLRFVLSGIGSVCYVGILLTGRVRLLGFIG